MTARLPAGAYEAIYAEHQRDHDDGPLYLGGTILYAGEPREGCPGCALLGEIEALRAEIAPRPMSECLLCRVDYASEPARMRAVKVNRGVHQYVCEPCLTALDAALHG